MKRCPTCNRTYTKEDQKFCPQDGTRLEEIEEVEFDPLKTIVATPKPSATDDAPPAPSSTPPSMPLPPREEEKPIELDPLKTMVASMPPSSSSSRVAESPAPPVEEDSAALEEKADEPPAHEESFDPFQTILGTLPPAMSELTPPAPSISSSEFDVERTIDRAPSESLLSEATPASAFAEPLTSQYAPQESAPYQTPEPVQAASDWGASQQPAEYGQQYAATPVAPSVPQEKKRKGAATISLILGLLSLLLVAVCAIAGLTKGMAFGLIYPMLKISAGTFPMGIIIRYLMIVVLFGLPFIGLIFGIYALIKSWKQPARYGGKGLALAGVLLNVLADVIFFASLSYSAWRLMQELQQLM